MEADVMPADRGIGFLDHPTRHLFFTGKGGVGKASLSTAAALTLADKGKRVLLVSSDAASNLDGMLGIELRITPVPVPGAEHRPGHRGRVLLPSRPGADGSRGQRRGARHRARAAVWCLHHRFASFDGFSSLLSSGTKPCEHIVFDTAPTRRTLRLLSLPKAWTGFLKGNDRGASCLGAHSGLKMQERRFKAALEALSDPTKTTMILAPGPTAARWMRRRARRTNCAHWT